MTFKRCAGVLSLAVMVLAVSGCPGSDENSTHAGLVVHLAEVHAEAKPGGVPLESSGIQNSVLVQGGYDQAGLEHHDVADGAGHLFSIYRAYLVLDQLALVPCTSVADLPRKVLDGLLGRAEAHAGHGSEPVGGRALDKPNVVDIVTQDEFLLPLGDIAVASGRYCGMRAALVRLSGDGYGKPAYAAASGDDPITVPEVPDLSGRVFSLRGDYCVETDDAGACLRRVKVDVDEGGLVEPMVRTFMFDQPMGLSGDLREAYVAVGIAYGEWVKDIDVTRLAADENERQRLLDNIANSIHIRAKGLGGLPVNGAP